MTILDLDLKGLEQSITNCHRILHERLRILHESQNYKVRVAFPLDPILNVLHDNVIFEFTINYYCIISFVP